MIDAFRPLSLGEAGLACADDGYTTAAARAVDELDLSVDVRPAG